MFAGPKSKDEESTVGGAHRIRSRDDKVDGTQGGDFHDLTKQKMELQKNIANSNNQALLHALQEIHIKEIERKIHDKEIEVESLSMFEKRKQKQFCDGIK